MATDLLPLDCTLALLNLSDQGNQRVLICGTRVFRITLPEPAGDLQAPHEIDWTALGETRNVMNQAAFLRDKKFGKVTGLGFSSERKVGGLTTPECCIRVTVMKKLSPLELEQAHISKLPPYVIATVLSGAVVKLNVDVIECGFRSDWNIQPSELVRSLYDGNTMAGTLGGYYIHKGVLRAVSCDHVFTCYNDAGVGLELEHLVPDGSVVMSGLVVSGRLPVVLYEEEEYDNLPSDDLETNTYDFSWCDTLPSDSLVIHSQVSIRNLPSLNEQVYWSGGVSKNIVGNVIEVDLVDSFQTKPGAKIAVFGGFEISVPVKEGGYRGDSGALVFAATDNKIVGILKGAGSAPNRAFVCMFPLGLDVSWG